MTLCIKFSDFGKHKLLAFILVVTCSAMAFVMTFLLPSIYTFNITLKQQTSGYDWDISTDNLSQYYIQIKKHANEIAEKNHVNITVQEQIPSSEINVLIRANSLDISTSLGISMTEYLSKMHTSEDDSFRMSISSDLIAKKTSPSSIFTFMCCFLVCFALDMIIFYFIIRRKDDCISDKKIY